MPPRARRDFYRFSVPGLSLLLERSGLVVDDAGSLLSGHDALRSFLMRYLAETFSFGSSVVYYALEYVLTWLLWPLELVEYLFKPRRRRSIYVSDSMVYAVGRKPSSGDAPATPIALESRLR